MSNTTIIIALVLSFIALKKRSAYAVIGILMFSALAWPESLRVPIGPIQMSAPRFIALLLLIKYAVNKDYSLPKFKKVDYFVLMIWIWTVFASIVNGSEFSHITQMIGRGLDTILMYYVARTAISNDDKITDTFFWFTLTAVLMAVMGAYESIKWTSPYYSLIGGYDRVYGYNEIRFGFLRASVSTGVSIYFGMSMLIITGIIWSLRGYMKSNFIYLVTFTASTIATLTSLSSGPWLGLFMFGFLLIYYKHTNLLKPTLFLLLFLAIILELSSNRHFYNLIDYLAIDKRTAWYRTRLLEVAFSQWKDYWLFGYATMPNYWAQMLDGRRHIDVVNNFIVIAIYGGFPAMIMYIYTHAIAIKNIKNAFAVGDTSKRRLVFGLGITLVTLDISSMSVGLYSSVLILSYLLLGMIIGVTDSKQTEVSPAKPIPFNGMRTRQQ